MLTNATPLVLIVDDARDMRDIYALYLEHMGMRTAAAASVPDAVATAMQLRPDVIVMDVFVAGATGDEVARALKGHPYTKDVPIICLSGSVLHAPHAEFARACDALLIKPCLPQELASEIRRVLSERHPAIH